MDQDVKSMGATSSNPREKHEALGEDSLPQPVQQRNVLQEKQKGLFYRFYLRLCEVAIVLSIVLSAISIFSEREESSLQRLRGHFSCSKAGQDYKITYIAIPGFFKQDKSSADPDKIGPAPDRFGLIDHHKHYWTNFDKKIQKLNKKSDSDTSYKVLFLGRHGEGFHNVGMDYYGQDEWDRKWGRKNGNGTITWGPDAQLTDRGVAQAERVHSLWQKELTRGGGIPLPTAFFVSPLIRALHTFQITFAGIVDDPEPLIIENLRDSYGLRTADLRHNKTWIREQYPTYRFEDGFTEQDELWMKDERETDEHTEKRVRGVLDKILTIEDTYLAIVAHSKVVEATFNITKHQDFDVPTGGMAVDVSAPNPSR
ncbi:hypothetical protein M407DRAFT_171552 [Tulasnella calospora MUT 4182]|uniref:Phosphoglycerate mutase n=1 Tax=Tulasnella calospora MUT 4182 TaxID=1051891 RepID=A0A0C3QDT1_9AGAM|nr:hypothetical protein M407DRAFT_171552 [Tulasnella calospora MUT 4182]